MVQRHIMVLAAACMFSGCAHLSEPACAGSPQAKTDIERTIHGFFDALRNEDTAGFQRLTTSSFYSYDAGKRYAGTELVEVVRQAHDRGVQLNWSIGPLDTDLGCDVAWSAWENFGSAGVPPDVKPVRWLESAVLVQQNGDWKVDFFHSQRAAAQ